MIDQLKSGQTITIKADDRHKPLIKGVEYLVKPLQYQTEIKKNLVVFFEKRGELVAGKVTDFNSRKIRLKRGRWYPRERILGIYFCRKELIKCK